MATEAVPDTWLLCPCCGRGMATIKVAIATPPFLVDLIGCETCGITTNELTAPHATADAKRGCGGT